MIEYAQARVQVNNLTTFTIKFTGWLGWAMVLGSFQCRGVLLLLHIVGHGPAVLAAGAGRVGYIFMPPTSKKLTGHIGFGLSVRASVRP